MNRFTKITAAACLTLSLGACSAMTNNLASLLASPAGQAFLTVIGQNGSLLPGIQGVLTAIDNGVAASQGALNTVCYAIPWADGALDMFGPLAGVTPTVISQIDGTAQLFLNGPCKTPPTNLAQAVTEGAQLIVDIQAELRSGGVPVAVPASARIAPHHR